MGPDRYPAGVYVAVIETVKRVEVLQKVQAIVRAELNDPALSIAEDTAVSTLPDWDSVAHFRIVIAIENEFEILFELEEHTEFETIGDVVACISEKLPQVAR